MVDVRFKVPLLQIGEAAGELLLALIENGTLARVPNEISSIPKSLPGKEVFKSTILRTTGPLRAPEFHFGLL